MPDGVRHFLDMCSEVLSLDATQVYTMACYGGRRKGVRVVYILCPRSNEIGASSPRAMNPMKDAVPSPNIVAMDVVDRRLTQLSAF